MSNFFPNVRKWINIVNQFVLKRPELAKRVTALAEWHNKRMGYRKYGLLKDDLINEEHEVVKEAVQRLTEQQQFDRAFRQRRAMQLNLNHEYLEPSEWITPEQDKHYLYPKILEVCKERDERDAFDRLQPSLYSSSLFNYKKDLNGQKR